MATIDDAPATPGSIAGYLMTILDDQENIRKGEATIYDGTLIGCETDIPVGNVVSVKTADGRRFTITITEDKE